MKLMKVIVGLILIAVGIWAYLSVENTTLQWVLGIVLVLLGLVMVIMGAKKKDAGTGPPPQTGGDMGTTPPTPPTPPETPAQPIQ